MVERVTLVVKGFVLWNDKLVTGFHPCCLRRSSFCLISGIVGDVIGILHLLEADLQTAVGGDVEFQFILGSDTVGCKIAFFSRLIFSRLIFLCFSENEDRRIGSTPGTIWILINRRRGGSIIESYHVYRTVIIHLQYGNRFSFLIQFVWVKNLIQFISLLSVERHLDAFTLMECQTAIFQFSIFVAFTRCHRFDVFLVDDTT